MEVSPKTGGNKRSERRSWLPWLLVLLFPIPFSPWWLGIIFLAAFIVLVVLLSRERADSK